ncbi:MAG: YraN family protein [Halanaerobiales bacterium]
MNYSNKELGDWGENRACTYLKDTGYNLVERNFRTRWGEIDIIARREDLIAFIEVKTRKSKKYGTPVEAVNRKKQHKIKSLARSFLQQNDITCCQVRFDIISIKISGCKARLRHLKNAF